MDTTCEKMASGTASRTDSNQMDTAFRQVQKTALDVWMSIGFTMALYLTDTQRDGITSQKKKNVHHVCDHPSASVYWLYATKLTMLAQRWLHKHKELKVNQVNSIFIHILFSRAYNIHTCLILANKTLLALGNNATWLASDDKNNKTLGYVKETKQDKTQFGSFFSYC